MRSVLLVHIAGAFMLIAGACSNPVKSRLAGNWRSKTDGTKLKITGKEFTMESDSPVPEDYFVKGDTIFTSFEGNLPYTKYVIKKLDEHRLDLFTPDSATVEYTR